MATDDAETQAAEIAAIVESIKPFLRGRGSGIQSAVLADLLALWLAGHHPSMRELMLANHLVLVDQLTEVNSKIIRGE